MLTRRLVCVLAGLAAATTMTGARVAVADDVFGSVDCTQSATPVCDLAAGTLGGANTGPTDDSAANSGGATDTASRPTASPDTGDQTGSGTQTSPPPANRFTTRQLRLPTPEIAVNPVGTQLVNVPTWLWLSNGWAPVSMSLSVPGVSMSATATPRMASWSTGDGGTETCTGPGTPFRPGLDPTKPSPDCGHIYRSSSASQPGQVFPVTVTLHWTITWSGAGHAGTYPDMTTTSSTFLKVAEAQALVTGPCPAANPC